MENNGDQQELKNIQEEQGSIQQMDDMLKSLSDDSQALSKQYQTLSKKGKNILKILGKKESKNKKELKDMLKFKSSSDINNLASKADRLKKEEAEEKALSYQEAEMLQQMLKDLQDAHNKAFQIMSTDKQLHNLIRETYQKDLDDFQLETEDLDKA